MSIENHNQYKKAAAFFAAARQYCSILQINGWIDTKGANEIQELGILQYKIDRI